MHSRFHRQVDLVILGVLVVGSLFIIATRAQVASEGAAPPVTAATDPAPLADHAAPEFTLATADGSRVTLSALRGQVLLVNIWATWCPPCRAEMPAIQTVYEQYRGQGFMVLAVNLQEDPRTVTAFLKDHGLTFSAPLDRDGAVSAVYQARVLPSSFFVDRNGIIRAVYRGPMPRGVIAGTVEQLLSEGR